MVRDPAWAALVHGGFEYAGIALGAGLYRRTTAIGLRTPGRFAIVVGLLLGAALGNKLVFWIERPDLLLNWWFDTSGPARFPMGQSLVGGLLGGLLGVELAKRLIGERRSQGDALVLPLTLGIAVGRIGCLLAGVHDDTWGLPSTLPWAWDPGDGLPRHPAPLYESLFVLIWGGGLSGVSRWRKAMNHEPGLRFKLFLSGYLVWRLLIDGLKPVPIPYALGASGIQWVCGLSLLLYLPWVMHAGHRCFQSDKGNP